MKRESCQKTQPRRQKNGWGFPEPSKLMQKIIWEWICMKQPSFHQSLRRGRSQRRGHLCTKKGWTFRAAIASTLHPPTAPAVAMPGCGQRREETRWRERWLLAGLKGKNKRDGDGARKF